MRSVTRHRGPWSSSRRQRADGFEAAALPAHRISSTRAPRRLATLGAALVGGPGRCRPTTRPAEPPTEAGLRAPRRHLPRSARGCRDIQPGPAPRDPGRIERHRHLEQTVHRILDDGPVRQTDLVAALPEIEDSRELRGASTLGTILPIWDTVDTIVHPAPPPEIDPEEARRELARRFFRHVGPATVADLQWWLDGSRADANVTAEAIASELEELLVDGRRCLVTAPFTCADPDPDAVLLLPPDGPYINRRTRDILLPEPTTRRQLWPQAPSPGALVIGGEIAGTWRRRATTVEFSPWFQVEPEHRTAAEEIAAAWPLGEIPGAIKWNPPA